MSPRVGLFLVVAAVIASAVATSSLVGAGRVSTSTATGTTSTQSSSALGGMLVAAIGIGPIQPVCAAGGGSGPPPPAFSDIAAVITPRSGQSETLPMTWTYDGCDVAGALQAQLGPGEYRLNLTSCPWIGCARALPVDFTLVAGRTTQVAVSIDTGIR